MEELHEIATDCMGHFIQCHRSSMPNTECPGAAIRNISELRCRIIMMRIFYSRTSTTVIFAISFSGPDLNSISAPFGMSNLSSPVKIPTVITTFSG